MLRRKMLRDMRKNFSQFITIFLMLLIGVTAYAGIRSYMVGMEISADEYYLENNLQDVDVFGKLSDDAVENVLKIEHVQKAEGKLSVVMEVKNLEERDLQLNFIKTNEIAKFYVVEGDGFSKDKSGIWVDEYFARNNDLKVGDKLEFESNGLELEEEIVGLIYTPDHVGYVKDDTEIFPVHDKYGYAYISQNELPKAMRFYSSIMIDVDDEENRDKVKADVMADADGDTMTSVGGGVGGVVMAVNTKEQYSAASYQGEIDESKTYVGIFSCLFIAIALLCVVTTMARIVRKDRTRIGVMKALGFSDGSIAWHYISYTLFLSAIGTGVGLLVGYFWFGKFFMDMQMMYFEVANYATVMSWDVWLVVGLIIVATCLTCYLVVRGYVRQPAAEILRVERPKVKSRSLRFTTSRVFGRMSFSSRWNVRDVVRNKMRTITAVVGVVGCMVLLVCGFGIRDTMNNYLRTETEVINNYECRLNLEEGVARERIEKLMDEFSHDSSETLTVEVRKEGELKTNRVFVNDSGDAVRTLDENWRVMGIPKDGVIITQKLAENEGYEIGDEIEWRVMGEKDFYRTRVVGMNRDPQNQNITMSREYYESLGREYLPNAIYVNREVGELSKGVVSIQNNDAIRDGLNMMLETLLEMVILLIALAVLLGVVIVYNMGVLSFMEKDYQFSTLKVLGFSDRKISRVFVQQNIWVAIMAIIIGLPLGYAVTDYIFKEAIEKSYDFGVFVTLHTCLISALGTFLVSLAVSIWLARRVGKIDMVKSLKANE